MGMFDTVYSDYKIFGKPLDTRMQTKSFENFLTQYYIDPVGQIFKVDYNSTFSIKVSEEPPFVTTIPTEQSGKVSPSDYTGKLRVWPDGTLSKDSLGLTATIDVVNGKIIQICSIFGE